MSFTTDITLLEKITAGDEVSWKRFSQTYNPLIRLCGKDWGLSYDERNDLVQDVLLNFFKVSKTFKYDGTQGHFRAYLRTITKNCILKILKKRTENVDPNHCNEQLIDYAFQEKWDVEWRNHLIMEILHSLEESLDQVAYQAFFLYVIKNLPPETVASRLGISVNAVYINKSRIISQLRLSIRQLEKL